MSDLLRQSADYIDNGTRDAPKKMNPTDMQLHVIADGIALGTGFSHIISVDTGDGLFLTDTSMPSFARGILPRLREWSRAPVSTVAYTHGHVDHVSGVQVFIDEAADTGRPRPRIIGHENVAPRLRRYQFTNGYNAAINQRQFGSTRVGEDIYSPGPRAGGPARFGPKVWHFPDTEVSGRMQQRVGDVRFDFHHGKGETDDHLWIWIPEHKAICAGDLVIWVFPNAGNPQKVQRYPAEWAQALREMIALQPELLLPSHGLPVAGRERIATMLDDIAAVLESLVRQSLELMNEGATLDTLIHTVRPPAALMEKPYLVPAYDEPEFVVRNIWRLYGGWYDGNPSHLKPAPFDRLSAELAELSGGATKLAERAAELADTGDLRLACHLAEMAMRAAPGDGGVHAHGAHVYAKRRDAELSLMARGIFGTAAQQAADTAGREDAE